MGEPIFLTNKRYKNAKGQTFGKGVWVGYGKVLPPGWGDFNRKDRTVTQHNSDGTKTVYSWEDWQNKQSKKRELQVLQNDRKWAIPFIPEKEMTITINKNSPTRKNAGATFSENVLDSIAVNSKKAGIPFSTGLGIAARESTLGYDEDRKVGTSLEGWLYALQGDDKFTKAGKNISYDGYYSPSALISSWVARDEYPFAHYQYDGNGNYREGDNKRDYDYYETDFNATLRKDNDYNVEDSSPLYQGFRKYKADPANYNHNDKNYVNDVNEDINELVNYSPEIRDYMKRNNLKSEGGNLNIWDKLSLKDKSDIIKVAINNGITTIPEIKEVYNKLINKRFTK